MSGGEQQRCAIARALAYKPSLLLLDEPFSNIDAITTSSFRNSVTELIKEFAITTIMVTHNIEDVIVMSERCLVMHDGHICCFDSVENLINDSTVELFRSVVKIDDNLYKEL